MTVEFFKLNACRFASLQLECRVDLPTLRLIPHHLFFTERFIVNDV